MAAAVRDHDTQRLKHNDPESEASLGYTARPSYKQTSKTEQNHARKAPARQRVPKTMFWDTHILCEVQ